MQNCKTRVVHGEILQCLAVSENIIRSFLIIVIGAAKPPIHGNYFTQ